ncbi:hypothetical protein H257_14330 [Aphanomyces astaci]|uniref:Helitron helicase-like domain-containing protein n=1 Tax=Aphanomyces astaci TaxID=112090 RepID=W4FRP6_APHAT|nr:hypothetical protein H257_14330 [Aphanomyces astaci]ETV70165.1 hypothetical protein H257_14330 [Aphanomyces astaci]|eukprot:XP_009840396.1 hypothetical protein H257_14330 [Aphanomyces astaci]
MQAPERTASMVPHADHISPGDSTIGDQVVLLRYGSKTRYQYERTLMRHKAWLLREHPGCMTNGEVYLPLDPIACKGFLAYECVKRGPSGAEVEPQQFKSYSTANACKSAIKLMHKESNVRVSDELETLLAGTICTLHAGTSVRLLNSRILDGIIDEALGVDENASAVDNEQAAVNGFSGDPDEGASEHECAYVERSVLFIQTASDMAPVNEKAVLESIKSNIHLRTLRADPAVPDFNVHTSNKISNYFEAGIDARMFPHLFPFGRGYTNERGRRVPVSKLQCCRLYCSLSSRRFAQDRYFVMVSFDRFGLDRGFINSNFSTKVRPSMHTPVAKISHDDMRKGLENQDSRRFGRTPKNKFVNKAVGALLRSVECSSSFVWGSNAERRMHRREAFATAYRFGQPSLFVTITPNVDGTITLAYLAGGIQVKSLFDVQYLKHMPDKATMQQLAMNDNMASATLFDRSIEAFTKVVVGFDKTTGRPRKSGGLFGHVKAYFGMVETQGRGTLHLHLLAWVYGAPRSTSEFEDRLQADLNYEAMVLKYSEGIVSNSLPIDLLQTPCKACEHVDTKYEALDPPLTAFEKPRRSEGVLPKELIMANCGHCNTMVSSQHLVRQALLHSRPKVWPVELPKLSQSAIDKYLDEETSLLKSTAGKKNDPERAHDHMRSSFQAYLEGTVHMESNVDYQELLADVCKGSAEKKGKMSTEEPTMTVVRQSRRLAGDAPEFGLLDSERLLRK